MADNGNKFTITNWIATVAIAASLIVGTISAITSYTTGMTVRELQARDTELKSFEDAAKQLQEAGAAYVKALNKGGNLSESRDKISAILARQSIAAINLRPRLKRVDEQYINDYIDALHDFNNVSKKISKPEDFRTWAESYGRTVDAASSLTQAISANAGRS